MDLKPLESVMVDAIVTNASDNCVALTMDEIFGNTHILVRPATVHPPIATARDKMLEEIRAVNMPDFVRSSVEAIINKHLGLLLLQK